VPELSRFFGIIIRMYAEPLAPHHRPHFHAYYREFVGVYGLEALELVAGSLPVRQRRLVEAWAELHVEELARDWQLLQEGRRPRPIAPLQ
jgi:hypothetical protein